MDLNGIQAAGTKRTCDQETQTDHSTNAKDNYFEEGNSGNPNTIIQDKIPKNNSANMFTAMHAARTADQQHRGESPEPLIHVQRSPKPDHSMRRTPRKRTDLRDSPIYENVYDRPAAGTQTPKRRNPTTSVGQPPGLYEKKHRDKTNHSNVNDDDYEGPKNGGVAKSQFFADVDDRPTSTPNRGGRVEEGIRAMENEINREAGKSSEPLNDRLSMALERNAYVGEATRDTLERLAAQLGSQANRTMDQDSILIADIKRNDKVLVQLKSTFLRICNIDTVHQQYEAEVFIQAKWEEPLLDQRYGIRGKDKEYEDTENQIPPWDPKLTVVNVEGEVMVNKRTFEIHYNEPGYDHPVVIQLWRFKGRFKETMELEYFPIDVQDLTISISSDRSDHEIELIEDQTALSSINNKGFMDQEWNLYTHIETFRDFTTVEYCSTNEHPILHFMCRVKRKTGYFLFNIIFIMLLIVNLTFTGFSIDLANPDRLIVTITLFLTAVAFKLVVQQSLPTISYLTYLDSYILGSLLFLTIQCAQNAAVAMSSRFLTAYEVQKLDQGTMAGLALVLILSNLGFAAFIYQRASSRRRIMKEKDRMYDEKKKYLLTHSALPPRYDIMRRN